MTDYLIHRLARLEKRAQRLLEGLGAWSPDQLRRRPSAAAWSALDVVDHLRLAEAAVLAAMQRNLRNPQAIHLRDRFGNAMILGVMLLPVRVKVPGGAQPVLPSENPSDLLSLQNSSANSREALRGFVRDLSPSQRRLGIFRHPVGGWTTPGGALLFLRSHLRHHAYQFRRLKRAL